MTQFEEELRAATNTPYPGQRVTEIFTCKHCKQEIQIVYGDGGLTSAPVVYQHCPGDEPRTLTGPMFAHFCTNRA